MTAVDILGCNWFRTISTVTARSSLRNSRIAVAGVSLMRLAGAYQQRMERQGEITAVLELETAKLAKARERFDTLFRIEGEQRLIREQSQWIAPNRLRVVWQNGSAFPTVQTAHVGAEAGRSRP